jgi:hypothetical protein
MSIALKTLPSGSSVSHVPFSDVRCVTVGLGVGVTTGVVTVRVGVTVGVGVVVTVTNRVGLLDVQAASSAEAVTHATIRDVLPIMCPTVGAAPSTAAHHASTGVVGASAPARLNSSTPSSMGPNRRTGTSRRWSLRTNQGARLPCRGSSPAARRT